MATTTPQDIAKLIANLAPDQLDKIADAINNIKNNTNRTVDDFDRMLESLEKQKTAAEALAKVTGDYTDLIKLNSRIKQEEAERELATSLEIYENLKKQNASQDQLNKSYEDVLKKAKQFADETERSVNSLRAVEKGKSLANLLGFDESNKNSLTYQIFSNPKEVVSGFVAEINNAGGLVGGFLLSTTLKVQEMTAVAFGAYDNAAASMAKVAGDNERLQSVLTSTARGATAYGISFTEAGKAIESLYSNLNTFSTLNQDVQEQLTISVAKLDKLGISGQEASKQIGTLSQIMGMSEAQAAKTSEELAGFALAIGKPPQQVAQDFASSSGQLAAYGKNMVNVFKDLEVQSKATGVAVGDLIGITEKFQTFEGAATAAGKLNAALGGGFINAMELLEASAENPAKAIDLLRTRLDEAKVSFNEMSFYEQKMIADAAGFKSIEEASRVLSMTNAEREKAAKADAERANSQKLLDDAIQRSIPLQEKLTMIMVNFGIVMEPVVDGLSWFLSLLAEVADTTGGKVFFGLLAFAGGMAYLYRSFNMLKSAVSAAGGFMNMIMTFLNPAAGKAAEEAGESIGEGIKNAGKGAAQGAPGIAAAGAALIEFGAGVALIVLPVALLVAAMGYLVRGFAMMFDVILGKGDGVATTLVTLGAAMFAIGIAFNNPIILLGMVNFAAALMGIVVAMTLLPEKKVVSFATISENFVKLGSVGATNKTIEQASELVKTINEFKLDDKVSTNLEKILKAAVPQQQTATTVSQQSPMVVKVFIGDKEIRDVVVKTQTGSIIAPAASGGSSTGGSSR